MEKIVLDCKQRAAEKSSKDEQNNVKLNQEKKIAPALEPIETGKMPILNKISSIKEKKSSELDFDDWDFDDMEIPDNSPSSKVGATANGTNLLGESGKPNSNSVFPPEPTNIVLKDKLKLMTSALPSLAKDLKVEKMPVQIPSLLPKTSKPITKTEAAAMNTLEQHVVAKNPVEIKPGSIAKEFLENKGKLKNEYDDFDEDSVSINSIPLLQKSNSPSVTIAPQNPTKNKQLTNNDEEPEFPLISNETTILSNNNPTQIDLERKLKQEQTELMNKYNRNLQLFQEKQEDSYNKHTKLLEEKIKKNLSEMEQEASNLLGNEINQIKNGLELELNNNMPLIKFPKQSKTDIPSLELILNTFRVSFENKVIQIVQTLNEEYAKRKEGLESEIRLKYDREIEILKDQWTKEGDKRIKLESETLVNSFESKIDQMKVFQKSKYDMQERELEQSLIDLKMQYEKRRKEEEDRLSKLEIEMGEKYFKNQKEWDLKFNQIEKCHEEYQNRVQQLQILQNTAEQKHAIQNEVNAKLQEVEKREDLLRDKERKFADKELELEKDLKKLISDKEEFQKSKESSQKYMESLKESLDREVMLIQDLKNDFFQSKQNEVPSHPEKQHHTEKDTYSSLFQKSQSRISSSNKQKSRCNHRKQEVSDDSSSNSFTDSEYCKYLFSLSIGRDSTLQMLRRKIKKEEEGLREAKINLEKQRAQLGIRRKGGSHLVRFD
jgi:hypothetical protein